MPNAQADARLLMDKLRERIARCGPMPVDRYMHACLADPVHGYWRRATTIGADGDFVTAPEISQIFGELIGLWSAVVWESMGRPSPMRLIELGPGRGTLMRDALRAARAIPQLLEAATVHLVEMSAPLREVQRQTLASHAVTWHETLAAVPPGPAIVIGNEFLDALPIRQLIFGAGVWRERVVECSTSSGLRLAAGPEVSYRSFREPEDGAIAELRTGEDDVLSALAARAKPCLALFIDYGPSETSFGDTLQAVRRHAYADPLAEPGAADLTAHVQFSVFADKARSLRLAADGPLSQAEFLGRLGIVERAARLMSANPGHAHGIEVATQRLISPTGMGGLFKALVVRSPSLPPPVPFG
jgi:SAM-dependent MidA family methyltransferase